MSYIDPIEYSKQLKNMLAELEVPETDPLADTVRQFATLTEKIDMLKHQLQELEKQHSELEQPIYTILEDLNSLEGNVDKSIKVGNELLVSFSRKPSSKTNFKYKEAFEYLYGKVNGTIKRLADEAKDVTKTVSNVKGSVKVSKLDEAGELGKMNMVAKHFSDSVDKLNQDFETLFAKTSKEVGGVEEGVMKAAAPAKTESKLANLTPDEQTQLKEYIASIKEIKKEIHKLMTKAKGSMDEQGGNMSSGLTLKDEDAGEKKTSKVNWNWRNASSEDAIYSNGKKKYITGTVDGKDAEGNYYTADWKAPVVDGDADMNNAELTNIVNTDQD